MLLYLSGGRRGARVDPESSFPRTMHFRWYERPRLSCEGYETARKKKGSCERKSCIRENICRQWSCVWRRVGQEQLGVCIYQPSSARSSAGVVYGQHSCTFTPVMPVFLLSVLSLASAALCAPLRETGWARRASKKGKGVQKQTSRQKRGLIPRNGA